MSFGDKPKNWDALEALLDIGVKLKFKKEKLIEFVKEVAEIRESEEATIDPWGQLKRLSFEAENLLKEIEKY